MVVSYDLIEWLIDEVARTMDVESSGGSDNTAKAFLVSCPIWGVHGVLLAEIPTLPQISHVGLLPLTALLEPNLGHKMGVLVISESLGKPVCCYILDGYPLELNTRSSGFYLISYTVSLYGYAWG